ncbi:MAG: MotA/TolQ/ExbB proton channel family protein [Gammaproteobacteria bacterium]|nr:MotA/TolQ/ExbB proton channel family protein [Gammaproteobacteria bacterium]
MKDLLHTWIALRIAGAIVLPLSVLGVLALSIMIEKAILYRRYAGISDDLLALVEAQGVSWENLEKKLHSVSQRHVFRRFFEVILANRRQPIWWAESRAADEAQRIDSVLGRRLWVLETIVTAAPLLGLLGTIMGMMDAFRLIGATGLVNPTGVTGGVARALIATAMGLLIALIALFGFNYFSRQQAQTLDELERLGTRLIDHIRLDREESGRAPA